jgi:hypothetical protein
VEPREQKLLKSLRTWVKDLFTEQIVLDTSRVLPLKELEKIESPDKEFDLIVKVLQIFKVQDNMIEVRVIDEGNEIWFT